MTDDGIAALIQRWRTENGDYPESKQDCANELEEALSRVREARETNISADLIHRCREELADWNGIGGRDVVIVKLLQEAVDALLASLPPPPVSRPTETGER